MILPFVSEAFVQFVWKFSLFSKVGLKLDSGEQVQIIYPGLQNFAGGPDFFNAKIYIGDTLWVGNVEIHLSMRDWHLHKHSQDAAYNNIILHVVYTGETMDVQLENKRKVPTICIGALIFENTLANYYQLQKQDAVFIPCQGLIQHLDPFIFNNYYESLLLERLERKLLDIENDLLFAQGDIDMAFNMGLFKYFGAPQNKHSFELLSRSFTMNQLLKQQVSSLQLESFLFGLADLLHNQNDYASKLQNEFDYTKKLYRVKKYCKEKQWNFAGVRPPNFPTVRLAQLAALLAKRPRMFSQIIEMEDLKELKALFEIEVSIFWQTHYTFTSESASSKKALSSSFINKLIINLIVPILFFYGKYLNEEKYLERALLFLRATKAEKNQYVVAFKNLGFPCINSFDSQALIELKSNYCNAKNCLSCRIGYALLK